MNELHCSWPACGASVPATERSRTKWRARFRFGGAVEWTDLPSGCHVPAAAVTEPGPGDVERLGRKVAHKNARKQLRDKLSRLVLVLGPPRWFKTATDTNGSALLDYHPQFSRIATGTHDAAQDGAGP